MSPQAAAIVGAVLLGATMAVVLWCARTRRVTRETAVTITAIATVAYMEATRWAWEASH